MDINSFFNTNYEVDNLLGLGDNINVNLLKHRITIFNRKFDAKIPLIKYAVDYIGLEMVNTLDRSDHHLFLLKNLSRDVIFLFTDLLFFDEKKIPNFVIKPTIIGIITKKGVELVGYQLIKVVDDDCYLYIRINHG